MLPIRDDPRKWESRDCKAAFIATLLAVSVAFGFSLFSVLEPNIVLILCNEPILRFARLMASEVLHSLRLRAALIAHRKLSYQI